MNNNSTIKAVVIGLGNIGLTFDLGKSSKYVFTHTRACMMHQGIDLICGVDPDENKRRVFEKMTKKKSFASLDSIDFNLAGMDLVIISTPTSVRRQIINKVVEIKPKCVLLEKPIAATGKEAEDIIALCEAQKILLVVNYFRYYHPKLQNSVNYIEKKKLGPLVRGVCHYSGGLINNASHYISLVIQWFNCPLSVSVIEKENGKMGPDFSVMFKMNFANSSFVFIPMHSMYDVGEVDFFFERGRIRIENYGENISCFVCKEDKFFKGYNRLELDHHGLEDPLLYDYQYEVLDKICLMLNGKSARESNAKNALDTIRICEKVIYET